MFTAWKKETTSESRLKLEQKVNKQTGIQIQQLQDQFQQVIGQLEATLSARLVELREEEESHRLMFEKYEGLVEKRKVENSRY